MGCNLNSGGDGRRGTRTDLKHVEDRQARARVPPGEGVRETTRARVTRGGGGKNLPVPRGGGGKQLFLNSANSSSLSDSCPYL